MKKLVIISMLLLGTVLSEAQQLPHYSQYMMNEFAIAPAVAGSKPYFEARTNIRNQWIGITDAPRTYMLTVQGPIRAKNMGIGAMLFTDITGPTRRIGLQAAYAYHIQVSDNTRLSFGLNGGLVQWGLDGSKITLRDEGDTHITSAYRNVLLPDMGFSMHLYHEEYFVSFSVPQIIQKKIDMYRDLEEFGRMEDHYYLAAGYRFAVGHELTLEPSVMVKYVYPVVPQADLTLRMIYKEDFWFGASYRTRDALCALVGFNLQDNLTFGYSFDYTVSNLSKYNNGTHEIMMGIKFLPSKGDAQLH